VSSQEAQRVGVAAARTDDGGLERGGAVAMHHLRQDRLPHEPRLAQLAHRQLSELRIRSARGLEEDHARDATQEVQVVSVARRVVLVGIEGPLHVARIHGSDHATPRAAAAPERERREQADRERAARART